MRDKETIWIPLLLLSIISYGRCTDWYSENEIDPSGHTHYSTKLPASIIRGKCTEFVKKKNYLHTFIFSSAFESN